jgi:hypothetical protein
VQRELTHIRASLWDKLGMVLGNPLLNEGPKLLGLLHKLPRLSFRHHLGIVVIENVPLTPARIKVAREVCHACAQSKLHSFERGLVVSGPNHAVARTGNRHLGKLKDRIIRSGKLTVGREARNVRVFEVPLDNGSEALKLSSACGVCLYPVISQ